MIASKPYVMKKIEEENLYPQKRYGQNFLISDSVADQIVSSLHLCEEDIVMEIGPGLGAITEKMISPTKKLYLYEIDFRMVEHLQKNFRLFSHVHVIEKDILTVVPKEKETYKIVGNLPYYITTPILEHIFLSFPFTCFTFMVQEEVEERLFAKPACKEYSPLSILISLFYQAKKVMKVSRKQFYPEPHVDSVVWTLSPKETYQNYKSFYRFLKAMFHMRRKNILNNLTTYVGSKEKASAYLKKLSIETQKRPEQLSPIEYERLFEEVTK